MKNVNQIGNAVVYYLNNLEILTKTRVIKIIKNKYFIRNIPFK